MSACSVLLRNLLLQRFKRWWFETLKIISEPTSISILLLINIVNSFYTAPLKLIKRMESSAYVDTRYIISCMDDLLTCASWRPWRQCLSTSSSRPLLNLWDNFGMRILLCACVCIMKTTYYLSQQRVLLFNLPTLTCVVDIILYIDL